MKGIKSDKIPKSVGSPLATTVTMARLWVRSTSTLTMDSPTLTATTGAPASTCNIQGFGSKLATPLKAADHAIACAVKEVHETSVSRRQRSNRDSTIREYI